MLVQWPFRELEDECETFQPLLGAVAVSRVSGITFREPEDDCETLDRCHSESVLLIQEAGLASRSSDQNGSGEPPPGDSL